MIERKPQAINRRLAFLAPVGASVALTASIGSVTAESRPSGVSVKVMTRFGRGIKNGPEGIWSIREAPCSQEIDMFTGKPFGTAGSVEVSERVLMPGTKTQGVPGTVGVLGSRDFTECLKK